MNLDTTPLSDFHVLHPFARTRGRTQLPQPIIELISEHVCKVLCEKDPDFAAEYVGRIFTPTEYSTSVSKQKSGRIRVYSLEHIVYYNSKTKSWESVPSVKKLQQRKEINEILNNHAS